MNLFHKATQKLLTILGFSETKLGANDNEKNNVLSANKRSYKLHIAVSVAFSYLRQCRVSA